MKFLNQLLAYKASGKVNSDHTCFETDGEVTDLGKTSEATCDGSDGKIKFSASVTCRAPKTCTADAFPSIPSDKNLKKTSVDPGTTKEFESYTLECKPGSKQSDDKTTFDLPCEKDGAWASSPGQISIGNATLYRIQI